MIFSVLVPVYNTSRYLRQCIESVLTQTERDYELILLDDGSTDESGAICDEYADNYSFVRVIHKENEGLLMTRRRGFKEAKGEFCICLDSDDYLMKNDAFSKLRTIIEEKHCDMVIYNYVMGQEKKEDDRIISIFDYPTGFIFEGNNKRILYDKLIIGKFLNPMWIKAIDRRIIDVDVDYSVWKEDICRGEDLFQSMPLISSAQCIGYLNEPLLYYRWTPGSISNNPKLNYYYAYRTIYRRMNEYFKIWNIDQNTIRKASVKRIPMVLNIVIGGYHTAKKSGNLKSWKVFVDMLSDDQFFSDLFPKEYKEDILLFYRLIGSLIKGNHDKLLALTLDGCQLYSQIKKRK